jgi:hypothetical protein
LDPVTDVREIARIAYGFKASKALFVGIDLDLFGRLSESAKPLASLAAETGVAENRLETLLTALTSLGLLVKTEGCYSNAPASEEYLVKGKAAYFGDYFSLQTDQFIFPAFKDLGPVVRGEGGPAIWRDYETLMQDSETAERFSRGQHAGSLGPAVALSKHVDISDKSSLLDVAGGSGAFTIMLCKRHPNLSATIFDFPTALPVARHFVTEVGLDDRVDFAGGNVITEAWPPNHDVVLMSFLFSAVAQDALPVLLERAYDALPAGGALIVHDFMVEDDKTGPSDAALWFLTCMFNCPEAVVLTPSLIQGLVETAGFENAEPRDLIPGLTKLVVARKP